MLSHLKTCAAAVLFAAAIAAPASARTTHPAIGGNGGYEATDQCPRGQFLIGFAGRFEQGINSLTAVCAAPGWKEKAGSKSYSATRGGDIGRGVEETCRPGTFVMDWKIRMTVGDNQVGRIEMTCVEAIERVNEYRDNPNTSREYFPNYETDAVADNRDALPTFANCATQELATGYTVRFDKTIKAIGLICDSTGMISPVLGREPITTRRAKGTTPTSYLPADYDGEWNLQEKNGRAYTVRFVTDGDLILGALMPKDGATAYSGQLVGNVKGSMMTFTFDQPKAGIKGEGKLLLMPGKKLLAGDGTLSTSAKFNWVATKK